MTKSIAGNQKEKAATGGDNHQLWREQYTNFTIFPGVEGAEGQQYRLTGRSPILSTSVPFIPSSHIRSRGGQLGGGGRELAIPFKTKKGKRAEAELKAADARREIVLRLLTLQRRGRKAHISAS